MFMFAYSTLGLGCEQITNIFYDNVCSAMCYLAGINTEKEYELAGNFTINWKRSYSGGMFYLYKSEYKKIKKKQTKIKTYLGKLEYTTHDDNEFFIANLWIGKKFRDLGYAKLLLKHVLTKFRDMGAKIVTLEPWPYEYFPGTQEFNEELLILIDFYQKLGFRQYDADPEKFRVHSLIMAYQY